MNTSEPARCAAANSTTGQQCANLARRGEWCQVHTESSRRYTGDGRLYRVCSAPNCQALATMVEATCIFFSRPGEVVSEVFRRAKRIYEKFGHPHEWTLDYQGSLKLVVRRTKRGDEKLRR